MKATKAMLAVASHCGTLLAERFASVQSIFGSGRRARAGNESHFARRAPHADFPRNVSFAKGILGKPSWLFFFCFTRHGCWVAGLIILFAEVFCQSARGQGNLGSCGGFGDFSINVFSDSESTDANNDLTYNSTNVYFTNAVSDTEPTYLATANGTAEVQAQISTETDGSSHLTVSENVQYQCVQSTNEFPFPSASGYVVANFSMVLKTATHVTFAGSISGVNNSPYIYCDVCSTSGIEISAPYSGMYFPPIPPFTTEATNDNVTVSLSPGTYSIGVDCAIGGSGSATGSATAQLSISLDPPAGCNPPTIISAPKNQTVALGDLASFAVNVSGTAPLFYQWQVQGPWPTQPLALNDGVDAIGYMTNVLSLQVSNSTTANLSLTPIQPSTPGTYLITVTVTNQFGSTNASATLTVVASPPEIVSQPRNVLAIMGSNAVFRASATGTHPLFYQWQYFALTNFDWQDLSDQDGLTGSQTSALTLEEMSAAEAGSYRLVVSNHYGIAISSNATLSIAGVQDMVPTNQYNALVDLYLQTGGTSWDDNTGWLLPHYQPWFGLEITNCQVDANGNLTPNSGTVSGLELSANNLDGVLPGSISNLTGLTEIDLSSNSLTEAIPNLSPLSELNSLDLSHNMLAGPMPDGLTNLTSLAVLDLSENTSFGGTLPAGLGQLAALTKLDVSSDALTGPLPGSLTNLAALEYLDASDNNLTGNIPAGIGKLVSLQHLDLGKNQFSGGIPPGITSLIRLVLLDLHENEFSGGIPGGFGNVSSLEYLDFSDNNLTGAIPGDFGNLLQLANLDLGGNQLSGAIPTNWQSLVLLTNLALGNNNLTGPIPGNWKSLSNLLRLDLSTNELSGPIPVNLGTLSQLEDLDLAWNDLNGDIAGTLVAFLGQLQKLNLSHNEIGGAIPPDIIGLFDLTELDLGNNNLSNEIPASLGTLVHLQTVRLNNNLLSGPIPDNISSLTQLLVLDLAGNYLTGLVPAGFAGLSQLRDLDLSGNDLSGAMPAGLIGLLNLETLDLSSNHFAGNIADLHAVSSFTNFSMVYNDVDFETNTTVGIQNNNSVNNMLAAGQTVLYLPQNPPEITGDPTNWSCARGSNAMFSVSAQGAPLLNYQWQFNGTNLIGATNQILQLNSVQSSNAGNYVAVVSNDYGFATSATATLTVTASNVPPQITLQPVDESAFIGGSVTFVASASGSSPLSYQWFKNGGALSADTSPSLKINGVQTNDAGTYSLVVTNVAGVAVSSNAALTVYIAPTIQLEPQDLSVAAGSNALLSVVASGVPPPAYQWLYGGQPLSNGGRISGVLSVQLSIASVQASDAGAYSVSVSNVAGSLVSSNAQLTVLFRPVITNQPQDQTVMAGANVTLSVGASGSAPLSFQWYKSPAVLLGGQVANTLQLAAVSTNNSGGYYVVVTNLVGAITSRVASVVVTNPPPTQTNAIAGDVLVIDASLGNFIRYRPSDGTFLTLTNVGPYYNGIAVGDGAFSNFAWLAGQNPANILKVNLATRTASSFASGASFDGVACHAGLIYASAYQSGAVVYVYNASTGALVNQFQNPAGGGYFGITWDPAGNRFVVAAFSGNRLDSMTTNGVFATLIQGNGTSGSNQVYQPYFVSYEAPGRFLVGYDGGNGSQIERVFIGVSNLVTTVAVSLNEPLAAAADSQGRIYLGNFDLGTLRRMNADGSGLQTLTGAGAPSGGRLYDVQVIRGEQTLPAFQQVSQTNGAIVLNWTASVGETYQFQYCTNLTQAAWVNLGGAILATNSAMSVSDSLGANPTRFYRVLLLP